MTLAGNQTRYDTLRPLVDALPDVQARWYPIRTWVKDDWTHVLPGVWRIRARHLLDAWPFLLRPAADAAIIHAFETWPLYTALHRLRLGVAKPRPVVVVWPDGVIGDEHPTSRATRFALQRTDLVVQWTTSARQEAVRRFPWYPPERIRTLHPGINLDQWPRRVQPAPDAAGRFQLLFVGADLLRKGITDLLDALDGLAGTPPVVLDVCTRSGYLADAPEGVRARLTNSPYVRMHLDRTPMDAEMRLLFARADAYVLPTHEDMAPWAVLEAQAVGLPVITTPVGGIPDMVQDQVSGLLVPPHDPSALARAIRYLHADAELRARLAARARTSVEQRYDARVNVRRFIDWTTSLLT
jgi:glycosyltransferase involved in cell wall biosynthesis